MTKLYENVDQEQLRRGADTSLPPYGTILHRHLPLLRYAVGVCRISDREIMTSAGGRTVTTASGHRVLDKTAYVCLLFLVP